MNLAEELIVKLKSEIPTDEYYCAEEEDVFDVYDESEVNNRMDESIRLIQRMGDALKFILSRAVIDSEIYDKAYRALYVEE